MDPDSILELEKVVLSAPEAKSIQLKVGMGNRDSVVGIHPSLINIDQIRKERNKILLKGKQVSSSLPDIFDFLKFEDNFIRKFDVLGKNPHIILQDDDMIKQLSEGGSPMQTDTVEGFLVEHSMQKIPNLTITSGYDFILERWVPLVISILFGKTANDYKNHFDYIFANFLRDSWDDFEADFPGNTSDFSAALHKGFQESLKEFAYKKYHVEVTNSDMVKFY